jgi:hypothetical protein
LDIYKYTMPLWLLLCKCIYMTGHQHILQPFASSKSQTTLHKHCCAGIIWYAFLEEISCTRTHSFESVHTLLTIVWPSKDTRICVNSMQSHDCKQHWTLDIGGMYVINLTQWILKSIYNELFSIVLYCHGCLQYSSLCDHNR